MNNSTNSVFHVVVPPSISIQYGKLLDIQLNYRPCKSGSSPYLLPSTMLQTILASDALRVEPNKGSGGAQPVMREVFIHSKGLPQTIQFPRNY